MTLDQCYATHQGQSVSVDGVPANQGQCAQWSAVVIQEVYGLPIFWGNAIDYWNSPGWLLQYFDKITDGSVKEGDFVIFNSKVGSVYGHIDVAMNNGNTGSFTGADSNWGGNKTVHLVAHTNANYVLGSLRRKGSQVNNDMITKDDTSLVRIIMSEVEGYNGNDIHSGKDDSQIMGAWQDKDFREMLWHCWTVQPTHRQALVDQLNVATEKMDKNDNIEFYRLGLHREGSDDETNTRIGQKFSDAANPARSTSEWQDQDHKIKDYDTLASQVKTLTDENTTLKTELAAADNQIKDPNKIIITNKGWSALWTAIQSFFQKANK